jgi:hypothetical protein
MSKAGSELAGFEHNHAPVSGGIVALHLLVGALGAWNLYGAVAYFVKCWTSLNAQGIGHLYFIVASLATSWWLVLTAYFCFAGNGFLYGYQGKGVLWWKGVAAAGVGAAISVIVPPLMQTLWITAVVFIRSLF